MLLEADLLGLLLIVDILGIIHNEGGVTVCRLVWVLVFGAPEMDASKPALQQEVHIFDIENLVHIR